MKRTVDVSIIILNHNTKELVLRCLSSLRNAQRQGGRWEVFVVDNGSTDGSVEALKLVEGIRLIVNERNSGFAAGNNLAIKKATGRYILLLNSDTKVHARTIGDMVAFMDEHKRAGIATCAVTLASGRMDLACHRGFPTPWAALTYFLGLERLFPQSQLFGQYHQGYKDMTVPHTIDCPSGAFFMVRKEAVRDVGLLDEAYFMYGEDLDWAYRIKAHGWEVWFNPYASVVHYKKQSGRESRDAKIRKQTTKHFYQAMILFYEKHYRNAYPWIVRIMVLLLLRLRIALVTTLSL